MNTTVVFLLLCAFYFSLVLSTCPDQDSSLKNWSDANSWPGGEVISYIKSNCCKFIRCYISLLHGYFVFESVSLCGRGFVVQIFKFLLLLKHPVILCIGLQYPDNNFVKK